MADSSVACCETEAYRNGSVTAEIVQQGTGNAARDINNAGRDINNITVLSSHRPKPAPSSTVPFRRDDDFVARDSLHDVHNICARPAGRAALIGLGGVGKSQIAIEYTHQVRDASPATWTFWVHAGTQARFEEGYRRIAEATKMDGWDDPQADVLRLVRSWLCDESNGRWMMVVDNADDADVFFSPPLRAQATGTAGPSQAAELLSDFLPQPRNGSVLVTSRSRDVAYGLTGSHASIFEIRPMEEGDALALLQKKLRLGADADFDAAKAKELLQALDRMPLAVTQAAAYIVQRAPRMTVARYLDELREGDRGRAKLLKHNIHDSRRDGQASNSIIATWQISFEHIRRAAPAAARLLSLMSLFDRQGIPESLLRDRYAADQDTGGADFDDDIYILTNYSLVKVSGTDGSEFEMHRLVQYSTKKWLELHSELEGWKARYAAVMDSSYPAPRYENWELLQALFPHAQAAVDCRPAEGEAKALEAWASVLSNAGWYAKETGQHGVAKEMVRSALEVSKKVQGPEHPHTLTSMSNLAQVLDGQGKYQEAETMHRQTLAGHEKVLGREHPDTLASMSNLAIVLNRQGKYQEAETIHRQTLAQREKVLGPEHPHTLTSMNNLAQVLNGQAKYEEAEVMNRQSLAQMEKVLGPKHPGTLTSMSNLAIVLNRQGKYQEAETIHRQTLAQREKVLGCEHPDTLTSMSNLAVVLNSQGKYEKAETIHRQTLAQREKVLGREHPDTLNSVYCLAYLLASRRHYKESLALCKRACTAYQTVLGTDHPTTRACRQHYSQVQMCSDQLQFNSSAYGLDSTANAVTGKASKLAR